MPISKKPKQLFNLDIEDVIIRNNFDALNRELQRQQGVQQPAPSANIAYSRGLSTYPALTVYPSQAGPIVPDQLIEGCSVNITTKGNPVSVKLVGMVGVGVGFAEFGLGYATSVSVLSGIVGWLRKSDKIANGVPQKIYSQNLSFPVDSAVFPTSVHLPIPTLEIVDRVPAGLYTYQLFVTVGGINTTDFFCDRIQAVAQETR